VIAVVVTFNREDLLRESLAAVCAQSRPVDAVIVVDNASDASAEPIVREIAPDADFVRLERNTGGAGGFTVGITRAMAARADLIWVMDDDTVPTETALEQLLDVQRKAPTSARLFGSRVEWTDGRPHPMNTPRVRPFASRAAIEAAGRHGAYPVRSISFVSLLIDARAVVEFGLPVADYFLWNDDFEYTSRILRNHSGFLCERSVVVHKTAYFGSTDVDPGARFSFEVRNKLWLLKYSRALGASERVLYSGATALNWLRTFARSGDRALLARGLREGVRESAGRPRPNADVLEGLDPDIVSGVTRLS
jgi:GT2 family glycosyltransferase